MTKAEKEPHAKGRASCIYCGNYENMSKEHIWADWLKAYIPREMERHKAVFTNLHADPNQDIHEVRKQEGDPHSRRLRVACRPCNHGWMSDLQQLAKPYLVPMLHGEKTMLYRNGQTALAAWATMFVMTADFLDKSYVSISANERRWLMTNRRPPAHWRIWIGQYGNPVDGGRWFHSVLTFVDDEAEMVPNGTEPIGNTQTSTILLGNHLIIHVMSSRIMKRFIRNWKLLPAAAPAMTQIWPVRNRCVGWPGAGTVTGRTIQDLAFHFFRRCDAVARKMEAEDRMTSRRDQN